MKTLSNEYIQISVNELGAELTSIILLATGEEYLWQGNPAYWKRQSPILFPIVGSVWNNQYRYNGVQYSMNQHGFARDMVFTPFDYAPDTLAFQLCSSPETKQLYPADFVLKVIYSLEGKGVKITWIVENTSNDTIHFQIGAHPAFNYRNFNPEASVQGYFSLLPVDTTYRLSTIKDKGCIDDSIITTRYTEHCIIPITKSTFNNDALILEDSQAVIVDLLDAQRNAYVRLSFDAPVIGLWSPACNSYAPFVCIEPWYGRCDRVGYEGEFANRDWMQHLTKGESFRSAYTIELL